MRNQNHGANRHRQTRRFLRVLAVAAAATVLTPTFAAAQSNQAEEATIAEGSGAYIVAATSGGEVYPFGAAVYRGSLADTLEDDDVVGIAATTSGAGYWLATSSGGVAAFGDASNHGDVSHLALAKPVVAIAATPTGAGYWTTAGDGGLFTFGDAPYLGSASTLPLAAPIVGMAATPSGAGYWLVASDGGVFSYGDAVYHGSTGAFSLNDPITAMVATDDGGGYWLFARDGGVFAFGNAPFHGSMGGTNLNGEIIVGGSPSADGRGYWLAGHLGSVFSFGAVLYHGSASAGPDEPITAIAARPQGDGYWLATSPGQIWTGPPVPDNSGSGRRIVYSNSGQRVWLIEANGTVFNSHLVSGRAFTPSPGTYQVFSKSRLAFAGHDGITMNNMVRFAHGRTLAIGFHSIPKYGNGAPMQTVAQLGTYRSSGCVRQRADQAAVLYEWSTIGTVVIVLA